MNQSAIGPNTALRYLKAYQAHLDYWHEVNPAVLLGYVDKKDHAPYIQEYAAEFPDSLVVARIQHPLDGGFHLPPDDKHGPYVASPQDYHGDYGWLGQIGNVALNVFNEPDGFADEATIYRLVNWFLEYIPIAAQNKTKSVLFNFGKGQPRLINNRLDAIYGRVFQLAAEHPELFYIGMHFYGPEDITKSIKGYVDLCALLGIKPLRVIGTEFGNDNRVGGNTEAAWEIEQVNNELKPFIESGLLIGLTRFQDGNSGGWDGYGIEDDKPYKDEIKRAAQAGELDMKPTTEVITTLPVVVSPVPVRDIVLGEIYRLNMPGKIVTAYPEKSSTLKPLGTIPDNAVVEAGLSATVDYETWLQVKYTSFSGYGWIKIDLISIRETTTFPIVKPDDTPTPALIPDVPKVEPPPPVTSQPLTTAQIAMLEAWRNEYQAIITKYAERVAYIDSQLASTKETA